jgi:hypothetical protein
VGEVFDDFLGLAARDFRGQRVLVFHGCSGSGKSTAIDWLLRAHPAFAGRDVARIEGPPLIAEAEKGARLVVIDEIVSARDLLLVARLLAGGARLLVATHLAPVWYRAFGMIVPVAIFRMDGDRAKIARHLDRLRLPASPQAVDLYVRRFGANYTDIDIIVERCPASTFDASLSAFNKFCTLTMSPARAPR